MQKVIIGLAPNITVEIASEDVKKIVEQASFWSNLPKVCPLCQTPLVFFHRTPQDNEYFGLACTGPVIHESNFGQYKQTERGLYYKGEWQDAYAAYQGASRGQGDEPNGQQPNQPNDYASATQTAQAPGDPVARSLGDMITAKQLGMIRALAREANTDADDECKRLMQCSTEELSKRAASDFIEHLQNVQRGGEPPMRRAEAPAPSVAPPAIAPPALAVATQAPVAAIDYKPPVGHGPTCTCPDCDIPF